jgi:two-component system, cell cycle response regulator DivK
VASSASGRVRRNAPGMTNPATKPLILIVEDFDDAREMYRDFLEFSGFRAETARDGREAIDKARRLQPDLILMDLSLPGIDGWEATRLLKAEPSTSHLLIVALSAHALATEGERARAAGCDGFIAKPCLPSDLVQEIGNYLKGQPATRERRPRSRRH